MALKHTKLGTRFLNHRTAEAVFHAVRYATSIKRPINVMVTITTPLLGVGDDQAGAFVASVRNSLRRKWIRERDVKRRPIENMYDAIIHENPPGSLHNSHWLLHLPEVVGAEEFERDVRRRVMRAAGLDDLGTAVHFKWKVEGPGGLAAYVNKGIDPAYAKFYHVNHQDMGFVIGRRAVVSRALGRRARKAGGWDRKTDRCRQRAEWAERQRSPN